MCTLSNEEVPRKLRNDPKYARAIADYKNASVSFRYHAYRMVSTDVDVLSLLGMKYTGVRHLLPTCVLYKIRSKFSSRSEKHVNGVGDKKKDWKTLSWYAEGTDVYRSGHLYIVIADALPVRDPSGANKKTAALFAALKNILNSRIDDSAPHLAYIFYKTCWQLHNFMSEPIRKRFCKNYSSPCVLRPHQCTERYRKYYYCGNCEGKLQCGISRTPTLL
eukprot:IDg5642t1